MENFNWKALFVAIFLIVFVVFFRDFIQFLTLVISDFTQTVLGNLKGGLSSRSTIPAVVRFCLTVIVIFGVVRMLKR